MRTICFFFLFLYSCSARGNVLADYFDLVNEAELLVCNDRLDAALKHYDKAFSLKRDAFGRDVYNAWVCAYLNNDEARFRAYSAHLLKKGAYPAHTMYMVLNQVKGGPSVAKYQDIWQQLKRVVRNDVDTVYAGKLSKLFTAARQPHLHFILTCGDNYPACARDSLNKLDSLSVLELKTFFETEGFATENRIGFETGMPSGPPLFNTLLRDDRNWTNRTTLDSFLYTRLMAGQYHPQDYAMLKDQSYNAAKDSVSVYQKNPDSRYASDLMVVINKSLYVFDPGPLLDRANAARHSIYLESLQDRSVKAKYQFLHPYFEFLNAWYLLSWDDIPEDKVGILIRGVATGSRHLAAADYEEQDKIAGRATLSPEQIEAFNTIRKQKCRHGLQH